MLIDKKEFAEQVPVEASFCGFSLAFPSNHHLLHYINPQSPAYQPYRESGLACLAKVIGKLQRQGTIIDIGANIGDSLAVIANHCQNMVFCVEGSDFYFKYLKHNIDALFKNRAQALHMLVLNSRDETPQGLLHWGGTARAVDAPFTEKSELIAIGDLLASAGGVALLKVDIDGKDLDLIEAAFADPAMTQRFPLYFEMEFLRNDRQGMQQSARDALNFYSRMAGLGYEQAFLWDDAGRFYGLLDLTSSNAMQNAINYMGHAAQRSVWGFDIGLVHRDDRDMISALTQIVSDDLLLPLSG